MNIIQKIREKIAEQKLAYLSERNNEKSVIDDLGNIDDYPRDKKRLYSLAGLLTFSTCLSFDIFILFLLLRLTELIATSSLSLVILMIALSSLIVCTGLFLGVGAGIVLSDKLHRKHFKKEYGSLTDDERFSIAEQIYKKNWMDTLITDEILNLTKIALSTDEYTELRMSNQHGISYSSLIDSLNKKETINKIKQEQQEVIIDIEELKQLEEIAYH